MPARAWRSRLLAVAMALGLAGGPSVALDQDAGSPADDITVAVTVLDADGRFMHALQQDDFTLYEDDTPQPITAFIAGPVPRSLGILWDASASLFTRDELSRVQTTVLRFALGRLDEGGELFLAEYSVQGTRLVRRYTSDRALFGLAFGGLAASPRRVDTAIYDAIAASLPLASVGRHDSRMLLVLSGGLDRDASAIPPVVLRRALRESPVVVHAWVNAGGPPAHECAVDRICAGAGEPASMPTVTMPLDRVVIETGGRRESVTTAEDFIAAVVRLERELAAQYRLSYRPAAHGHAPRTLRVEVRDTALTARTRLHAVLAAP